MQRYFQQDAKCCKAGTRLIWDRKIWHSRNNNGWWIYANTQGKGTNSIIFQWDRTKESYQSRRNKCLWSSHLGKCALILKIWPKRRAKEKNNFNIITTWSLSCCWLDVWNNPKRSINSFEIFKNIYYSKWQSNWIEHLSFRRWKTK